VIFDWEISTEGMLNSPESKTHTNKEGCLTLCKFVLVGTLHTQGKGGSLLKSTSPLLASGGTET